MRNRKNISLLDLKSVINYTFDLLDDEIDASLYFELDEIPNTILNRLEVVTIGAESVTVRFTDFIRDEIEKYPERLRNYLEDCWHGERYIEQFFGSDDITDDGGGALYMFIEVDLYDYLTERCR